MAAIQPERECETTLTNILSSYALHPKHVKIQKESTANGETGGGLNGLTGYK